MFCEARMLMTLSVSRSAGSARRMAEFSACPLPARPVPNSLRRIEKRSRNGRRMMLLSRSRSTVCWVLVTGSRCWPAPSWPFGTTFSGGGTGSPGARGWVGEHSTYFSPISDCGRMRHDASERKSVKPALSISRTIAALLSGVTASESILPTLTPAILTSSPWMTEKAESKIARTL